jgi:hypothetical protein
VVNNLQRAGRFLLVSGLLLLIGLATLWAALALWYRLPAPPWLRGIAAALFALAGLTTTVGLFGRWWLRAVGAFLVMLAIVMGWWLTILPATDADWAPDVARQVTGRVDGDQLTLTDVRAFDWRSDSDFTPHWQSRS